MNYLISTPNPSGAYTAPQSNAFPGAIPLTDEQAQTVVDYNGFVTITRQEEEYEEGFFRTVYTVEPNLDSMKSNAVWAILAAVIGFFLGNLGL